MTAQSAAQTAPAAQASAETHTHMAHPTQGAQALLWRYRGVWAAVAARYYVRLGGRVIKRPDGAYEGEGGPVPMEILSDAAREEAMKACRLYDARRGTSPAPYIRRWAAFGVRAAAESYLARQDREVYPDGDADGERSRWEVIAGEAPSAEDTALADEHRAQLRDALQSWAGDSPMRATVLRLWGEGATDAEVIAAAGITRDVLQALRTGLRSALEDGVEDPGEPDEAVSIPAVSRELGISPKRIARLLARGELRAAPAGGVWRASVDACRRRASASAAEDGAEAAEESQPLPPSPPPPPRRGPLLF